MSTEQTTQGSPSPDDDGQEVLDQETIAILISELSSDTDLPIRQPKPNQEISPEDVTFSDLTWISHLFVIQGWLKTNELLKPELLDGDPAQAIAKFFSSIGYDDNASFFVLDTGILSLTPYGFERLNDRLMRANSARQTFREALEDGATRQEATRLWIEKWDELESDQGAETADVIHAETSSQKIQFFACEADLMNLDLSPSYQRSDVWSTADAQKLIESVMLGIPLPSVIILEKSIPSPETNRVDTICEVVDGKQRLTSILRFMGRHPEALKIIRAKQAELDKHGKKGIDLLNQFQTDFKKFRKTWKAIDGGKDLTDKKAKEYFFPFKTRTSPSENYPLKSVAGKYYTEIQSAQLKIGHKHEDVKRLFDNGGSTYVIPTIKFVDCSPAQIHNVFHLYNKQGKHLNAEEIRNAVYHDVLLLRMLHALSGDGNEPKKLASFLYSQPGGQDLVDNISSALAGYGQSGGRYKATKALSWIVAAVLYSTRKVGSQEPTVKSTAILINEFLKGIQQRKRDFAKITGDNNQTGALLTLANCLSEAIYTHSECEKEYFPKDFKGGDTFKYDLELVATMIGFFLVTVTCEDAKERLEESTERIYRFLCLGESSRPTSAQNKTQWAFISKIAIGIAECCNLTVSDVDNAVRQKFGVSAVKDTLDAFRSVPHLA
jgi:hypothetical protein